jgi:hypothetical protein
LNLNKEEQPPHYIFMDKQLHPNYIKSSNLILATLGLGLMNTFFSKEIFSSVQNIATAATTLLFIAGLAYLVRQGKDWVKYLLLVVMILGMFGLPFIFINIIENPVVGVLNIAQTAMQVWAVVLLFKIPKQSGIVPNITNS